MHRLSALLLFIATMIAAGHARADSHPGDDWPICNAGIEAPVCLILAHLIEPGSEPFDLNPDLCENGELYRGTDFECRLIDRPMSGPELRDAFPDAGRDIIGLTVIEPEPEECNALWCHGGTPEPWTDGIWHGPGHNDSASGSVSSGGNQRSERADRPDRPTSQPSEPPSQSEPADPSPPNCD